ncbi:MAG: hypothetical protein RL213_1809 [Bacteroidota bacterium]|jgi:ABC-type lipoprotein release transport system permease subunit
MIVRLIWRNLFRNKRRSLITMASVSFAVLLAISFRSLQMGVFRHLIRNVAGMHTGYLQIHRNGYQEEPTLDNSLEFDSLQERMSASFDTAYTLLPRLESYCLISGDSVTKGSMIIATEPDIEDKLTALRKRIVTGKFISGAGILLAEGLADDLAVSTGDTVVVFGQGYEGNIAAGKYPVSGIVHFASPGLNKSLAYIDIATGRDLFSAPDRITSAVVLLKDDRNLSEKRSEIADRIGNAYEVVTWQQILPDIDSHIKADTVFFYIEIGVLYVVIAFGIFGTLIMMTNERRRENGMLLAVGMTRKRLGAVLFGETLLLGGLGALTGALISLPLVYYLTERPIRFSGRTAEVFIQFGFEPVFPATVDPIIFLQQAGIVFLLSAVLGSYPYLSALRMDPLTSMKNS